MSKRSALALSICLGLLLAGSAGAAPIGVVNGETQLNVTSFGTLTDLGVTVSPGGTAVVVQPGTLPSPQVFYEVTSVDLVAGQIFHVGSVLDLSTTATVTLADFVIDVDDADAGTGIVTATVTSSSGTASGVPVFDISKACTPIDTCAGLDGTVTIAGLELRLTTAAGELLSNELGIDDLSGTAIAVANSTFTPIPEPGTAALGMLGFALLGLTARRCRRD